MRLAETCLTGIAFLAGVAASLGAVLNDPDLVYTFNWAHAKFEFGGIVDMSMYAGFQAFCVNTEISGITTRACQSWEDLEQVYDIKCDGSAPPPPAHVTSNFCTNTCSFAWDYVCDDGGPGQEYSVCTSGTDCVDCGPRSSSASGSAPPFADVLCTNIHMSMFNTILWYTGIGCMLIKFLIQRCIIVTVDRRRPKAIADSVLSFLSTVWLAVVLIIYYSSCYPGEAFEDFMLHTPSLSAAQVQLLDGFITPSLGMGFFLGCGAAAAMFSAFCLSVVLAYLSVKHGERASDVFV